MPGNPARNRRGNEGAAQGIKRVTQAELQAAIQDANATTITTVTAPEDATVAGNVFGPSTATDGAFALYDGTTGKLLKSSTYTPATLPVPWANLTGVPSSFTPSSHTHAASDVTSGTFGDARISQSSVTQHQAALSIGWSQLTSVPSTFTPSAHTHPLSELTQSSATTGQAPIWNGSAWVPTTLGGGTGTVTSITAGTGLSGGTITTLGTIAVVYGTTAGTSCQGNDSRLSDSRTPTAHTHPLADLTQSSATTGQVPQWNGSAWVPATVSGGGAGTVTSITAGTGLTGGTITTSGTIAADFGTSAGKVCEGNDARLSDARTPTAHTHGNADITDLAWTKLTGVPSTFAPSAHTHAWKDLTGLPWFAPEAYGAVGDGATDDTTALQSALTAAASAGGAVLLTKRYKCTSTLTATQSTKPLAIIGNGTAVIAHAGSNLSQFTITQTSKFVTLHLSGFRMSYDGSTSTGHAIKVSNSHDTGNDYWPNLIAEAVHVFSENGTGNAVYSAWILEGVWNAFFSNCTVRGDQGSPLNTTGFRFKLYGSTFSTGLKCIGARFANCQINSCYDGIRITDSMETCVVTNSMIVGCTYGVRADSMIHLGISNTHMNCTTCVKATGTGGGIDQAQITGNLLYALGSSSKVLDGQFARSTVSGNSLFGETSATGTVAIEQTGTDSVFASNVFYGFKDRCIYFTSASSDNRAYGNRLSDVTTPTTPWEDAGTDNRMGDTYGTGVDIAIGSGVTALDVDVPITEGCFGRKPSSGSGSKADFYEDNDIVIGYDYTSASSTKTSARFRIYRASGGTLPNATRRFNFSVYP